MRLRNSWQPREREKNGLITDITDNWGIEIEDDFEDKKHNERDLENLSESENC